MPSASPASERAGQPQPSHPHPGQLLTGADKGLPTRATGLTVLQFLGTHPRLSEFLTPLLVLDDSAVENNLRVMAGWCAAHGFSLMPHGKTTMAPALWQRQLDAGAHAITLATSSQVRTALSLGFTSLVLANELVDAAGLRYIAAELADPRFQFTCWVDSVRTVELMDRALEGTVLPRPINVCVELGAPGGRTGARTIPEAIAVARRTSESSVLRLAGVAGYEGSLAHDRSPVAVDAVRTYLSSMLELHAKLAGLYDENEVVVSVGGSAFFDLVSEVFEPAMPLHHRTRWALRAGAYITHDHGFYSSVSPLDARSGTGQGGALQPAMLGLARVVSRPEPGLALLDAGKRDFPYDEGLPIPLAFAGELGAPASSLHGASISAMNDQHSYLRLPVESALAPGDVVTVGLSHPCTAFDKWRRIPVVATAGSDGVVDLIDTWF